MSDNKLMEQLLSRCYAINLDHTKMNSDLVKFISAYRFEMN